MNECRCNYGVVECPLHPGRLLTKEQKIDSRKHWDEMVEQREGFTCGRYRKG